MILGWLSRNRTLHIGQRRIHHGRVGALLAMLGLALMLDDAHDWPWRYR